METARYKLCAGLGSLSTLGGDGLVRRFSLICVLTASCSLVLASASSAKQHVGSGGFTLVQSATLVHPGNHSSMAAEVSTTGNPFTWGAVEFSIPSGLTLSQLTNLSTDYKFVTGSCWGGSPRFEVWVTDSNVTHKIFFYLGPPPNYTGCPPGAYSRTGNLATPSGSVDAEVLAARRNVAAAQLAESVAALEGIRLDLLRLHAGASDLAPLTTLLDAARLLGEDVSRLADAQREVDGAAGRPSGAGRIATPA